MRVIANLFVHVIFEMTSGATVMVVVPPQLSEDTTEAVLGTGTWLAHWTVTFAGHVIEGAVLSKTVITCVHVAVFPQASVA